MDRNKLAPSLAATVIFLVAVGCSENVNEPDPPTPILEALILGVDQFPEVPPETQSSATVASNPAPAPAPAGAGPVTIDFSGLPGGTLITTQFASLGVTFSGGLFARSSDFSAIFPSGAPTAANFFGPCCPDITASFAPAAIRVGFFLISNERDSLALRAFRSGTLVSTQRFDSRRRSGQPADSFGIAVPGGFDALVIDVFGPVNGAFVLDDFTFESNRAPTANAGPDQTIEWEQGLNIRLDGTGSSDPDGDALTYTWRDGSNNTVSTDSIASVAAPGLGTFTYTLTVSDGQIADTDSVTVTIQDTTPPEITAALVAIGDGDDDEGRFRVEYGCSDTCDTNPQISAATLNGIPVSNGQIVELELDDDDEQEVEYDDGVLSIEASSFALTVSCVDASGNQASVSVAPAFADDDDDDDDENDG